jgi:HD-GYP domain-containing protein (c-di-GMP phosphodiesterase class II)
MTNESPSTIALVRSAAVSVALHERDAATHDHCDRVAAMSVALGQSIGLAADELRQLALAAVFHDIGKIGIPDDVLKKPGRLTAADWALMKTHALRGERIIRAAEIETDGTIARAIRHHHERIDGAGYPDGLAGESIPVLARIIAIADAYDAMGRMRMYGAPRTHPEIIAELQRHAGRQHDAFLVRRFEAIVEHSPFRLP